MLMFPLNLFLKVVRGSRRILMLMKLDHQILPLRKTLVHHRASGVFDVYISKGLPNRTAMGTYIYGYNYSTVPGIIVAGPALSIPILIHLY